MNDRARRDVLTNQRHRIALARHDERQGAAHDFARNNHDLALAGLFLGKTTVNAIGFLVRRFHIAAGIHAVNLDRAGKLGLIRVVNLRAHCLAELVAQHEGGFVLTLRSRPRCKAACPLAPLTKTAIAIRYDRTGNFLE